MRHRMIPYMTLALCLAQWAVPAAQVPTGSAPPSYGQKVWAQYDSRFVRQSQLIFTLIVPSGALQSVLPPGYTVPPGETAVISVNFGLQQREELPNTIGTISKGTYGPASVMIVQTEVIDPDGDYEQLLLDNERSTDDSVSFINGLFGDGSARKPSTLTIKIQERPQEHGDGDSAGAVNDRIIRFSGHIENESFGLMLDVQATVPAAITTAVRNSLNRGPDGVAERFRFINGTVHPPIPNASILQVINDDRVTVPSNDHVIRVEIPEGELQLPEGTLRILHVGPTVTLLRNRENFQVICTNTTCP